MASCYRAQLTDVVRAVGFTSATTYSWLGKRSLQLAPQIRRVITEEMARSYLLSSLQTQLYAGFYARGGVKHARNDEALHAAVSMQAFVQTLSQANSGGGYWDSGWEVRATEGVAILTAKDGLDLWVQQGECLGADLPIKQGDRVCVRFPKELLGLSPGYYMALSDTELCLEPAERLLRLYWNLTTEGVVPFVREATSRLNALGIPFKLKVVSDKAGFDRCDSGVLYLKGSHFPSIRGIVNDIYRTVHEELGPEVPALTKRLAPGLGLAEDPGSGQSFGEHRCRLVADGLIRAREQGHTALTARLKVVTDRLAEAGVNVDTPFLNAGSADVYELGESFISNRPADKPPKNPCDATQEYLNAADAIGQRLRREAVWFRDRCNWLGAVPRDRSGVSTSPMAHKTLGPDFYSGTSGVALFLSELFRVTGDVDTRRAAVGAISHALSKVDEIPLEGRVSFYTGCLGVAFVAARLGMLFDREDVFTEGRVLAKRVLQSRTREAEVDLLSGIAGGIVALMLLRDLLKDDSLVEHALELGDEVLERAEVTDAGYSWASTGYPHERNLTGFSHGPSGIGMALLELFAATGETRYKSGAGLAFAYERSFFDNNERNWPDFREDRNRRKSVNAFGKAWCHGAPGVALARLRAYELLGDDIYRREAQTALETTCRIVTDDLSSRTGNFSLCHGMGGNADVLLYGSEMLGESQEHVSLAARVGDAGIEQVGRSGRVWPCGAGGGETPDLMLGLAGIGHFYLRLHSPQVNSVLMPVTRSMAKTDVQLC